jgi:dsRNA-specific ribonuclease
MAKPATKKSPAAAAPADAPSDDNGKSKVISRADRAESYLGDAQAILGAIETLQGAKKLRAVVEAVVQTRFAQREVDKMRDNMRSQGLSMLTAMWLQNAEKALEATVKELS